MIVTQETTLEELYSAGMLSIRSFNCCRYSDIISLYDAIQYYRTSAFKNIRNCGRKSCEELEDICESYSYLFPIKTDEVTQDHIETVETQKPIPYINEIHDLFFTKEFNRILGKLSVRGRNTFNSMFKGYRDLLFFFDVSEKDFKKEFSGKKKTADELYKFLIDFKRIYDQYSILDDSLIEQIIFKDKYPFLLTPELDFVKSKEHSLGRTPMLYVVKSFFNSATDRHTCMFEEYYGITNNIPKTLDEIAEEYLYSRERVRQILSKYIVPQNIINIGDECWQYYIDILPPVICENSPSFCQLVNEEELDTDFTAFTGLLCCTLGYDTLVFHNKVFLVHEGVKVEVRNAINAISSVFEEKYTADTRFNLSQVFQIHKPSSKSLYILLIKLMYNINIQDDGIFVIPQGRISIEDEIIDILESYGEPLNIETIFGFFKEKYPEHKFNDPKCLRSYIIGSTRILSRGKSGFYGLKEWDFYTGTIRDYAYEMLENEIIPMSDDILVKKVLELFPDSNHKSIISSLLSDSKNRFVHFQNSSMGIASKQYNKSFIPCVAQIPFEVRIRDLYNFLEKYQRYPFSDGGEFESSLHRWLMRYFLPKQDKNSPEYVMVMEVLEKYDLCPHNEKEYKFLNQCNEYKHFITMHYCMPKPKSENIFEKDLANWFLKAHSKIDSYKDNRSKYYNDLLCFLSDYGFVIDK